MREVTQHEPGTLCWTELATTNADSAKALYGALFDWTLTVRGRIQGSSSSRHGSGP
jgi:predicted enzyme related to lactoylglutathione lyase